MRSTISRDGTSVSKSESQNRSERSYRRLGALGTPTDLTQEATRDVSAAMKMLLTDVVAPYVKTKNFQGHMSGPHFRDYHRLLDEQRRPCRNDRSYSVTNAKNWRTYFAFDRRDLRNFANAR